MIHWAAQYIGLPWSLGGRGPDSYDCYGLASHIQIHHYGHQMPDVNVNSPRSTFRALNTELNYAQWIRVDQPLDGDCVLMSKLGFLSHIGVWVGRGASAGVLHCEQQCGVIYQSPLCMIQHGWGKPTYFRFNHA